MARHTLELSLVADRDDPGPLTSQIAGQLRDALAVGRLATGERLPSTRMLADLLGVSRTVVTGAYTQLFAEGWVEGRHGSGTYVADGAPGRPGGNGSTGPGARWEPGAVAAGRAPADRPAAGYRVDRGDRPCGVASCLAQRRRDHYRWSAGSAGQPRPARRPHRLPAAQPRRALFPRPARGDPRRRREPRPDRR